MVSSQPLGHPKPTINTEFCDTDGGYYPSTPPLSTSGSVISRPRQLRDAGHPHEPHVLGLDGFQAVKEEPYDADSQTEKFPVLDWSSCASPQLQPGT